jgi:hypothetical protein
VEFAGLKNDYKAIIFDMVNHKEYSDAIQNLIEYMSYDTNENYLKKLIKIFFIYINIFVKQSPKQVIELLDEYYYLIENPKEIEKHHFVTISESDFKEKARDAKESDPDYIVVFFGLKDDENVDNIEKKYYKKETHNYKAYSYCGTVCKNYLMYKSTQYAKKKIRNTPYDEVFEEISNSTKYSTMEVNYAEIAENLVGDVANEIERMVNNANEHLLTIEEVKVGRALIELLRNWEEVLPNGGSNKLQKSSVLYFLREETMMSTKEVRDNMKKYKCVYKLLKKMAIE